MKQKGKRTLTPKRRFPEFRDAPGWEEKSINSISDVNPSHDGLPDSFVYIDLESVEQGKLVAQKVINREGAPSRAQRLLSKRDVIYQTVRPYQRNNLFFDVEDELDYVASTGYAQLRAHASPAFLFQLLHTNDFVNKVLAKCTGSNYPAINSSDLATIEVAVPSPAEQKKIAECLSSLDGLITAEGRKLDALRDHKCGLMQQLFPQPGQTQPRLRFPEFRDKGEWEDRDLGPMTTKVGSGITPRGGDKNYRKDGRVFVRSQNVGWGVLILDDVAYIEEETHSSFDATEIKGNDVLLNITGASIGRSAVADYRLVGGNVNQHVCIIRTKPKRLHPFLLNQYLISEYGQTQIDSFQAGGNRQGLNFGQIRSFMIPMPPVGPKGNELAEQQKIADCLTALDTLIAAQAGKIEALKQHKRGLMQQLFPTPEEV